MGSGWGKGAWRSRVCCSSVSRALHLAADPPTGHSSTMQRAGKGLKALVAVICQGVNPSLRPAAAEMMEQSSPLWLLQQHPWAGLAHRSLASSFTAAASPGGRWGTQAANLTQQGGSVVPTQAAGLAPSLSWPASLSPHPPTHPSGPLTIQYPWPMEYFKDREVVVLAMPDEARVRHNTKQHICILIGH